MIPFQANPVADFSEDTWWIWLVKAVFILVFLLVSVLMALWVERRVLGRMQTRLGPNVHGPFGLYQSIGDALKLVLKEDFWLKGADKVIYLVSMVGEVNRLPFDLPEAEGELVAGHMVEYSSMKFAWYFLAEYINMFNVSGVAVTLFLGGWRAPWPISAIGGGMFNEGWWPMLWFIAKVWIVMFLMIWTRGTLLRFRYDQFMKLGWKVLIPVALTWVVMVSIVQGVRQFTGMDLQSMLMWIAGVFLAILLLLLLWPAKKEPPPPADRIPEVFDAFEGGYPVPPMPGQELPPSPRRRRREAAAMSAQEATDE